MTAPQPRARNTDRDDAKTMLDAAYASGQLTAHEHHARVAAATAAATLAQLHRLVSDLQTPDGSAQRRFRPEPAAWPAPMSVPARAPSTTARTGVIAACAISAGLVAVFVGFGPYGGNTHEIAAPTSMVSAASLGRMLDDLEREFGDLIISDVTIYPEYASISRPIADKPGQNQNYNYKIAGGSGVLTEQGTSNRHDEPPSDLAQLRPNLPRVVGLIYGAGETLRVPAPVSPYLLLGGDTVGGGGGATMQIYVSNDDQGASGSIIVGYDGVIQHIRRADS